MAAASGPGATAGAFENIIFRKPEENRRGIPEALFIENIEETCANREPAQVVAGLQDLYTKYQYMQSSLAANRSSLKTKLPDITQALETVNHLVDRRDVESSEYTYQLSENIYARATVPATNSVCLWLGANVMLEYGLDEAVELLRTNEANAKTTLKTVEEDVAYLRDQITTTEVNIARSHNYGVKVRQEQKAKEAANPDASTAKAPAAAIGAAALTGNRSKATGSAADSLAWKQDDDEVEVSVAVPANAKKADVKVTILAESLKVEHSGKMLLDGPLAGKCRPGGSTWTLNAKANRVEVTLEKAGSGAWASLFEMNE